MLMPDFHTSYSSMPTLPLSLVIHTMVLQVKTVGHLLHCEAWLEEQNGNGLHHFKRIDLVAKEGLLPPHRSHQQVLVFDQQRKYSSHYVQTAFQKSGMRVLVDHLVLRGYVMHALDCLCFIMRSVPYIADKIYNIVGLLLLDPTEVVD